MTTPNTMNPAADMRTVDGQGDNALLNAAVVRAADNMAVAISETAMNWHDGEGTVGVSTAARKLLNAAVEETIKGAAALRASSEEAAGWLSNLDYHPDGRAARAKAAREAGQSAAADAARNAENVLDLAEQMLVKESAPSYGDTHSQRASNIDQAKKNIRMTLDTAEGGELLKRIQMLAEMPGPISAMVTDEFLSLYLMSRGIDPQRRDLIIHTATQAAVRSRAERGDRSAILALKVGKLRGAIGGVKSLAQR